MIDVAKITKAKTKTPCFDEVFVASEIWGVFYHFTIETLPRIFPYVEFLNRHPVIKIHIARSKFAITYFEAMGIQNASRRTITGTVCAKLAYLPQGSGCGTMLPLQGQSLSHRFRNQFAKKNRKRNKVILIVRTKNRMIVKYRDIAHKLRNLAKIYGLEFIVFKDNPPPSFKETLHIFHDAFLIVAPHGAGLTNILWSEPGTYILEVLCYDQDGPRQHYIDLAWSLGHYYYGFPALSVCKPGEKGLRVNAKDLLKFAHYILKQYKMDY